MIDKQASKQASFADYWLMEQYSSLAQPETHS